MMGKIRRVLCLLQFPNVWRKMDWSSLKPEWAFQSIRLVAVATASQQCSDTATFSNGVFWGGSRQMLLLYPCDIDIRGISKTF